jgi:hypothetical protein
MEDRESLYKNAAQDMAQKFKEKLQKEREKIKA